MLLLERSNERDKLMKPEISGLGVGLSCNRGSGVVRIQWTVSSFSISIYSRVGMFDLAHKDHEERTVGVMKMLMSVLSGGLARSVQFSCEIVAESTVSP